MSDYVPDQDLFDQFLQEGDWVNPEATWTDRSPNQATEPVTIGGISPFVSGPQLTQVLGTFEFSSFEPTHQTVDPDPGYFQDLWLHGFSRDYSDAHDRTYDNSRMSDGDAKLGSSPPNYCEQSGSLNHHVQGVVINEGGPEDIVELDGSPGIQAGRNVVGKETITDKSRKSKGGQEELVCTFLGCTTKQAFRRPFELNRHMKKHTRICSYGCPIAACNCRGSRAFYREDKLKAHLRSVHEDFEQSLCPISGCGQGPLQFDLLGVHLSAHGKEEASEVPVLTSCHSYYRSRLERRCQVEKCRVGRSRWMPSNNIPGPGGHLMLHDKGERLEQRASTTPQGYDVVSCGLICPICKHICPEEKDFRRHLGDAHMTVTEHARLYVDAIRSWMSGTGKVDHQWSIWESIPFPFSWCGFPGVQIKCPGCSSYVSSHVYGSNDPLRHPGLITPTEELYAHRREILRILPDFHEHPVFDDVRRTQ